MAALLTEQEVARQLGVSVITLRTWRQRPPKGVAQLRYVKMGGPDNGSVRYRQEHLDQYIEERTRTSTTDVPRTERAKGTKRGSR
jgi:hypothetical protein